jgi:FG-GAP-like repeat/FG-GAP repeat
MITMRSGRTSRLLRTILSACQSSLLSRSAISLACTAPFIALIFAPLPASAQFAQQGDKLVGIGAVGSAEQGRSAALSADGTTAIIGAPGDNSGGGAAWVFSRTGGVWTQQAKLNANDESGTGQFGGSVALSADGNTAVVGGPFDNSSVGAVWVFTRSGGVWTQQGSKLVGTGAVGNANQGTSAALSADGNTVIVGGENDNSQFGASWVFTRSGGVWMQQGPKLVGSSAVGPPHQGASVALSADGNTAIIGGLGDDSFAGAAWVFTRSGGVWAQQGSKLVGTGAVNSPTPAEQGLSVAVSADGNTAIVGGPDDTTIAGATWVFTRNGGVWTQQGSKLVGTGAMNASLQGLSVAVSANGNTAIVGAVHDNSFTGAAWVFTRSGSLWTQQGSKLVGIGAVGAASQGISVAMSGSGTTALVGGITDNSNIGAAWVFAAPNFNPTATHDFNGDGISDILWLDTNHHVGMWLMNGSTLIKGVVFNSVASQWSVVGQRDFNGDGFADILWRDTSGNVGMWLMNGTTITQAGSFSSIPTQWSVAGTGDFNGDGKADILWVDTSGNLGIWFMDGTTLTRAAVVGQLPANWVVVGSDMKGDVFLRNMSSGDVGIWVMSGDQVVQAVDLGQVPLSWTIAGIGDFDGNGSTDILWRNPTGAVAVWLMNGLSVQSSTTIGNVDVTNNWTIAQTGDYNGDGISDILWVDTAGDVAIWFMLNGLNISSASLGNIGTSWTVQSLGAD